MTRRVRSKLCLTLLTVSAFALPAHADGPIVHEYLAPDASEDLRMGATSYDGTMPAAIDTRSGVLPAPAQTRVAPNQVAYGGSATPDSIDASYRIDRDTTRPESVRYDDPFIPAVTPFKRLYAFDALDEGFEFVVHDKLLRPIEIGGEARPDEDQFYGDLFVDVSAGVPVRVPSVGPGARVLVARSEPARTFELARDGADNWFITAGTRERLRLVLELSIPRRAFGSEYGEVSWAELARAVPALSPAARVAADDVLRAIGVSQSQRPREAVHALVDYFRNFAPSDDAPRASAGAALYTELALSRKGVCRHRAYAFVVSALGLGIPARLVRNEAHAWVEVSDASSWHRIDLGGAASHLDYEPHSSEHQHQPPKDPYRWPAGAESGGELSAEAGLSKAANAARAGAPDAGAAVHPDHPLAPLASAANGPPPELEPARRVAVSLGSDAPELRRGARLHVFGTAGSDRNRCPFVRVDIALQDGAGAEHWLGALATDQRGSYDGRVALPYELEVGDYSVVASTPVSAACPGGAR